MASYSHVITEEDGPLLAKLRELTAADVAACLSDEERTYPEVTGDFRLLRFLRGFQNDPIKAAEVYSKMLKWYQQDKIGDIRRDIVARNLGPTDFPFHAEIIQYYPINISHKTDLDGNPTSVELLGRLRLQKLVAEVKPEDFLTWHKYHCEWTMLYVDRLSRENNRLIKTMIIYDLNEIGMHIFYRPALDIIKAALAIAQDNYPEQLERAFFINTPGLFSTFWKLIRPMLDPTTLKKVHIYGENEFQMPLMQVIAATDIPRNFGGLCQCPGGCIPAVSGQDDPVITYEIGRSDTYTMPIFADKEGIVVTWKFDIDGKNNDIKFGAKFIPGNRNGNMQSTSMNTIMNSSSTPDLTKTDPNQVIEVAPTKLYTSGSGKTVSGSWTSEERGTLTFSWENPSSFRSKTIRLEITVDVPKLPAERSLETESPSTDEKPEK